jgi:superfamily I DNA and/or RNA helicase
MFGISNRMAYDGQMVHAPLKSGTGAIGGVLGPSTWFDIVGKASSKWCLAEGRVVIDLLTKLSEANVFKPDLYIITPFREVSQEMKALLRRHTMLLQKLGLSDEWMKERVGTVHTVQGREADSVILILGAPSATDHRARVWAAGTPNILNVAVTRAKQHLYVVGSYEAWAGIGHAKEFEILPRSHFDKVPSAE